MSGIVIGVRNLLPGGLQFLMEGKVFILQRHARIGADPHPVCISRPGELHRRWASPAVLTLLVTLLGTLLLAAEGRTQDLAVDRAALVALYNATNARHWKNKNNWLSDKPLDEWHGVTVQNGRVTGLFLANNHLTGRIPSNLGDLANLQEMDLSDNHLTGSIPPELGNLANLRKLDLDYNWLRGPIPSELSNLANLERLVLLANQLTGPIPPELANLANLEQLSLAGNELTGSIPSELSNLANLEWLTLSGNQLTGAIPFALSNLANLERLRLSSNQLTGPIPPELGNLANLERLILFGNRLTGPIPPELGNLANLEQLFLFGNRLTGPIPSELGNLANLKVLWLSDNLLSGHLPPELGNLPNLDVARLANNQLTGPIPPELGNLANLRGLTLTNNQLTGSIPSQLGNLANLLDLSVSVNQLTGPIPPELGNLAKLRQLALSGNQLTGFLPSELGNLANLEQLRSSHNQLTGSIPSELGNLAKLQDLFLVNNQLTGSIPSELGNLANLEKLWLGRNQLTGFLPSELGNLAKLEHLTLSFNRLTGPLPSELGNLAKLEHLSLGFNQLTGAIPLSFARLKALDIFWFPMNPGLCVGADVIIRNWLDGVKRVLGADCSPAITLSVIPSNLVEGSGATPVMVTARQTPVSNPTNVNLLVGGTANLGGSLDYTFQDFSGSFNATPNAVTIPANNSSGTTVLNFVPLADGLMEGTENIILQAFVGSSSRDLQGEIIGGSAVLSLNDQVSCAPRDRAALEALYHATGGSGWTNRTNWLSPKPLSEWYGVTVDNNGCVTNLDLSDNQLTGTLPFQLGYLVNLEELVLSDNRLANILPPSLTNLVALQKFRYHLNYGLCTQEDLSILTWLESVGEVRGLDCSSAETPPTVAPPTLTRFDPTSGPAGTQVTLTGTDFLGATEVLFNGVPAARFEVVSETSITAVVPPAATSGPVSVVTPGGTAVGKDSFTVTTGIHSRLFVPIVLRAQGRTAGSFFTSELTLTNRGTTTAAVHYTYAAAFGGGSGTAVDFLEAGGQKVIPGAIAYLAALGVPIGSGSAGGTLAVDFSNLSSASDGAITLRVTTPVEEGHGRAGLAYAGLHPDGLLTGPAFITGLRQNSQDRSNVAVQNAGDTGDGNITARVTVYSGDPAAPGRSLVLPDLNLPPGWFYQYNGILNMAGFDNGYVKVERVSGRAPFYAYGVINDNFNSDGSFVFPLTEFSLVGTSGQTLPVIIETGNFRSELTLTNFSAVDKAVDFRFVADAVETDDDTATFSLTLKAGEQRILPDIVGELRRQGVAGIGPANGAFVGALFATVAEGDMSGIAIGARTGAPDKRGGQYSVFYNGVPFGSASVESAWIYGLQQNAENRSNLALVNAGEIDGSSSTFEITIYDGSGDSQPNTKSVTLGPRRWTQENGILGNFSQGYVHVRKTSGNNPFIAYGVVNDGGAPGQRSGDGAFLPAQE